MASTQFFEPPNQEAPLGGRGSQLECPAIGIPGLVLAAETPQQLAAGRVKVEVAVQVEAVPVREPSPQAAPARS